MKVILPSGDVKEFEGEVNLFTVAKSISNSLAKKSVAAKVNDELVDMSTVLNGEEFRIEFITPETEEGEEIIKIQEQKNGQKLIESTNLALLLK